MSTPGNSTPAAPPPTVVPISTWSAVAEMLGKQLGAADILGVAVIFTHPETEDRQIRVGMCVAALTEELRMKLSTAIAPLIGADAATAEKKIFVPMDPN